jgi:hypothetical protein
MTVVASRPETAAAPIPVEPSAVLVAPCDGYAAGTTGTVIGHHQGCAVFVPDRPNDVARWAQPRTSLLVPESFVATID